MKQVYGDSMRSRILTCIKRAYSRGKWLEVWINELWEAEKEAYMADFWEAISFLAKEIKGEDRDKKWYKKTFHY